MILALNKMDRVAKPALCRSSSTGAAWHGSRRIVPVSALTARTQAGLLQALAEVTCRGRGALPPDYLTDQPERAYVAEIVREKVLRHTRDELPFHRRCS